MNRSLLLGAAALLATGTASFAADLPYPVKAEPVQVFVPAFSWTGFYLGGNAGYAWGDSKATDVLFFDSIGGVYTPGGLYAGNDVKFGNMDGWVAGGQIGYNYQFTNNVVVGIEADFQWTGAEDSRSFYATVDGPYYQTSAELEWFGTVRARLGYAFDRLLVYGTGGFAYGQGSADYFGLTSSSTQTGWTLGLGAEVGFDRNWSAKLEYLYVDLGSATFPTVVGPVSTGLDANILRAGVNYRF